MQRLRGQVLRRATKTVFQGDMNEVDRTPGEDNRGLPLCDERYEPDS